MRDRFAHERARDWSTALASALDEVTAQVDTAVRRLADGWPDGHGGEWTERLQGVRHALQREIDAALEFGRAVDRTADEADGPSPGWPGPQLGGTAGRRVDDARGVRIPRLNDDPGTDLRAG